MKAVVAVLVFPERERKRLNKIVEKCELKSYEDKCGACDGKYICEVFLRHVFSFGWYLWENVATMENFVMETIIVARWYGYICRADEKTNRECKDYLE